ncbi:helix-turn-helix transcriptional regulator [Sorangium sp. So ce269]
MMRDLSPEALLALAGLAYEMPLEQGAPERFTQALAQACGATAAGFTVDIFAPEPDALALWTGLPDESTSAYVERFFSQDPWRKANEQVPVGRAHPSDALIDRGALGRTSFSADFCRGAGIADACYIVLHRSEQRAVVLGTTFGGRLRSPEPVLQLLETLAPHVRRAVALWEQAERTTAELTSLADSFERQPLAAVLLDRRGRIVRFNQQAAAVFSQQDGLVSTPQGLSAADRAADRVLRSLANAAGPVSIQVKRPSGRRPYVLVAHPLPAPRARLLHQQDAAILVYLVDPEASTESKAALLCRLFKLSPAEARLCVMLGDGTPLKEAAQQLGVSYHTVRFQLQRAFAKTGTDRQGALIALLTRIGAAHGAHGDGASAPFRRGHSATER